MAIKRYTVRRMAPRDFRCDICTEWFPKGSRKVVGGLNDACCSACEAELEDRLVHRYAEAGRRLGDRNRKV